MSALRDQQLAGTIMWVPAGMVFLVAALALLKPLIDSIASPEGSVPQKELK
jgi:cytochrome c oxidase assembly factor CtaG